MITLDIEYILKSLGYTQVQTDIVLKRVGVSRTPTKVLPESPTITYPDSVSADFRVFSKFR